MKRWLLVVALAVVLLGAVLLARALTLESAQPQVAPAAPLALEPAALAGRLARALTYRTVSTETGPEDPAAFTALHEYLAGAFPLAHARLERTVVGGASLAYAWAGSDPDAEPILLLAHLDVVPVERASLGEWTHAPFGGIVADGFVWGRGALDDKAAALGALEAIEHLLSRGFVPCRGVHLALGHDEEVGGRDGARVLAARLGAGGRRYALVLDEGQAVLRDVLPGFSSPVALVGIAEKGYVSVRLTARGEGGHSSMPSRASATTVLAHALVRLGDEPFSPALGGAMSAMFDALAPETGLGQRLVLANRWLFEPLLVRSLLSSPRSRATLVTTVAPTVLAGGVKDNVIPTSASAIVNLRVLPGETIAGAVAQLGRVIDDERVTVEPLDGGFADEPSPTSRIDVPAYSLLARTIREVFPDALVAPALVVGATDARHYRGSSDAVYRFAPFVYDPEILHRLHGIDERVSVDGYAGAVRFYVRLIENLCR